MPSTEDPYYPAVSNHEMFMACLEERLRSQWQVLIQIETLCPDDADEVAFHRQMFSGTCEQLEEARKELMVLCLKHGCTSAFLDPIKLHR